ncbi:MAG TPA: cation:proton antiporter [Anaeromyxobacteraceae bacterium]|nr:cation:proton antiporter [Anaeromyxobacteraceae bacterium]
MSIELALAALGAVILVSALAAGFVDRAPLSFPIVFLALGAALGPRGAGVVRVEPHSPALEVLAVFTLSLILFLDAVNLERTRERRDLVAPLLAVGPGTLLVIALGTAAAAWLLHVPIAVAAIVGSVLASTDPVVLRDVTRDPAIPLPVRRVLSIESGANDVVVLPVLLVLLAVTRAQIGSVGGWVVFLGKLLVIGPVCGLLVGGVGAWLMARIDARLPVRREFQSLYGIGLVLASYGVGAIVGVDGFLAAFAAGLGVTLFNQTLCDCFIEYGAATAEIAMLLAFGLFGALLSDVIGGPSLGPSLLFAAVMIFVARPLAMGLVLLEAPSLSWPARALIAWFGPRGLSSLLFALLVLRTGLPEGMQLLAVVGTTVVASVLLHGISGRPLSAAYARVVGRETLGEERESTASGLFSGAEGDGPRVDPDELAALLSRPDPPLVLDVRSRSDRDRDPRQIPGSIRVPPDEVEAWARGRSVRGRVITYCT